MARLHLLDLPLTVNEVVDIRVATKHGEEAPRIAARIRRKE